MHDGANFGAVMKNMFKNFFNSPCALMKHAISCVGLISLIFYLVSCGSNGSIEQTTDKDGTVPPLSASTAMDVKAPQKVLRLLLQYKGESFSILNSRVVIANPTPLPEVADHAPLIVQTLSKSGAVLSSGGIHDPRLAKLDIEDPNRPGIWQHKDIALSESVFQLKIPIEEGLSKLHIIENPSGTQLMQIDLAPYLEEGMR